MKIYEIIKENENDTYNDRFANDTSDIVADLSKV